MRDMILLGRVVNDAQLKQTKNGRSYLEFRFANNEYGDPENSTYWFRVVSFQPGCINIQKWITKGKPLLVVGRYADRLYTTQAGVTEIGRDITATSIEFVNNGDQRQHENGQATATATANPQVTQPQTEPTQPMVTNTSPAASPTDPDDELPF